MNKNDEVEEAESAHGAPNFHAQVLFSFPFFFFFFQVLNYRNFFLIKNLLFIFIV